MTTKPPGNHARLAAAVVIAAVVIGAGIVASSNLGAATTVTRTVTTALLLPCNDQVWSAGGSSIGSTTPVLLMRPGSTAYICVTYRSPWGGNSSQYTSQGQGNTPYWFGLEIATYHCVSGATEAGCGGGWAQAVSHSFRIDASPGSIQPTPDTDYVAVAYAVTALSNSTGFYDSSAPEGSCGFLPMAVGYAASQENASDFPGYVAILYLNCVRVYWAFVPTSVSVGGMNVTYVDF